MFQRDYATGLGTVSVIYYDYTRQLRRSLGRVGIVKTDHMLTMHQGNNLAGSET